MDMANLNPREIKRTWST